jgi:hypothetical protein
MQIIINYIYFLFHFNPRPWDNRLTYYCRKININTKNLFGNAFDIIFLVLYMGILFSLVVSVQLEGGGAGGRSTPTNFQKFQRPPTIITL